MLHDQCLRVLLVDDEPATSGRLLQILKNAGVDVRLATDLGSTLAVFAPGLFDVAILDLRLDRSTTSVYSGIALGGEIRAKDPELAILMYSQAIEHGHESDFTYYRQCYSAGADAVWSGATLLSTAPADLAEQLWKLRDERLASRRADILVSTEPDIHTRAAVETLGGEEILSDILRRSLPDYSEHNVQAMLGGYSEALLLRVSSSISRGETAQAHNILKINREQHNLAAELAHRPTQGTSLDAGSRPSRVPMLQVASGWYVFPMAELRDAIHLDEYLQVGQLSRKKRENLKTLVMNLLVGPASETTENPPHIGASGIQLRYAFVASVLLSMRQLRRYCTSYPRAAGEELDLVESFVKRLANGYFQLQTANRRFAQLHGDFHCRNVLVDQRGQAMLVDHARTDYYPRLFDFANLEVDLIARLMDSVAEWKPGWLPRWLRRVRSGYPLGEDTLDDADPMDALRLLLHSALRGKFGRIESPEPLEYAEALLFHLLRYLRFDAVSLPKRMLVAKWAADLLRRFHFGGM